MKEQNRLWFYLPILLSIAIAVGYLIGYRTQVISDDKQKLVVYSEILNFVENNYVDDVNREALVEESISSMLTKLDPHSSYIPADQADRMNEQLEGSFGGVGISFRIFRDTLMVLDVIDDGPSARSGILPGDRIIAVDDEDIAGTGITNNDVYDLLKGMLGTTVNLKILRNGDTKTFHINRGVIPLKSVSSYFMINSEVGYIHLNKFSKETHFEFLKAINILKDKGMRSLVFDLRGNRGGYLNQAIGIADEFLSNGNLIVYTQGRKRERQDYYASRKGVAEDIKLTILIDEESASASEIVAGAIQDNDRGYVVGRRSFGKGLVQEIKRWSDNSELRLTVQRYYTPSGRSIQKPYGEGIDYRDDYNERYENGEYYHVDSSLFVDSLRYYTKYEKRPVYGGGGIMPDYFVALDTVDYTDAYQMLASRAEEYVFYQLDSERDNLLKTYGNYMAFNKNFNVTTGMLDAFLDYVKSRFELKLDDDQLASSEWRIKLNYKRHLAWHLYGESGASFVLAGYDNTIQKALEVLGSQIAENTH